MVKVIQALGNQPCRADEHIYNMYKLLCIIYNDHHLMHCALCYVKCWKSWLCSSTTATSRKQVTNRLYVAVFSLILIPRLSRHLH